jgi:hypothetical protein
VKRLIVLLIVIAGGLAAAAFAVPSNAATVNGTSISQQQLNSDLNAIAGSAEYQCYLNAQEAVATSGESALPPITGAGQSAGSGSHPTVTTAFAATYLDTAIGHQLILELAEQRHLQVTAQEISTAHAALVNQITAYLEEVSSSSTFSCGSTTAQAVLASMPPSFVAENVRFDATVGVFEENVAGVGSSTADLERYFNAHAAQFDTVCITLAAYSSQSDAAAAVAQVAAGTPFAQVAAAATSGHQQGCYILYGVAAELPTGTNLGSLPLNTVSSPVVASNGSYLVVETTKRTPTSFAKAKAEVESAVQNAGATKARTEVDAAEKAADVWVNARYGRWVPVQSQILPPTSPPTADVLNPSVNGSGTVSSQAATPSTGQTP